MGTFPIGYGLCKTVGSGERGLCLVRVARPAESFRNCRKSPIQVLKVSVHLIAVYFIARYGLCIL